MSFRQRMAYTHKIVPRPKKLKKKPIPKAIREQVWLRTFGKVFESKCKTSWCQNMINVWDFHAGHNIPESKGGPTKLENLVPICSRCNLSMGDTYTFTEWNSVEGGLPFDKEPPEVSPSLFCGWFGCC